MKKFLTWILILCLIAGILPATALADSTESGDSQTLKILFVGNSFSQDATDQGADSSSQTWKVFDSLLDDNVELTIGLACSGGKTLAWHATHGRDDEAVESFSITTNGTWESIGTEMLSYILSYTDWDIIVLQPYAAEAQTGTATYGDEEYRFDSDLASLSSSIPYLLQMIHQNRSEENDENPDVYYYIHLAYNNNYESISSALSTSSTMYSNLISTATTASTYTYSYTDSDGETQTLGITGIVPVATAIQVARSTYLATLEYNTDVSCDLTNDPQLGLTRDGHHVSYVIGRYIAALTFAYTILPEDMLDTSVTEDAGPRTSKAIGDLPEEYIEIARTAAAEAVALNEAAADADYDSNSDTYAALLSPTTLTDIYGTDPAVAVTTLAESLDVLTVDSEDADTILAAIEAAILEAAEDSDTISDLALSEVELSVTLDSFESGEYTATVYATYGYTTTDPVTVTGTYTVETESDSDDTDNSDNSENTSGSTSSSGTSSSTYDWWDYDNSSSSSSSTKYDVDVDNADTENGTVEVSKSSAKKGATVTITVTPDDGYELDELLVLDEDGDEIDVTDNGDGTYTFTMPKGEVTITATFMEIEDEDDEDEDTEGEDASEDKAEETVILFTDVTDPTAYYYDAVYWAYENGITTGTTDLTFSPEQTITRKELVTMLYRLAGEPETAISDTAFTDIYGTQYDSFRSAILWAESIGLTAGKGTEYTFCPDDEVTRAEIVTFLQRYEVLVAGGTANVSAVSSEFTDVADPDEWYYSAVYWAYENGITEGNSGYAFTFGPNDACTRGEFVTFLYRYAG